MMAAAKPSGTIKAFIFYRLERSWVHVELVIENVVRRVLFIVREEQKNRQIEQDVQEEKSLEKVDLAKSIQFKLKRTTPSPSSLIRPY